MNSDVIKISVIMPVYNMEAYIEESIKSVLSQSLTDLELICIDDGSSDNSKKIIKDIAFLDERVKYIYQENRGSGIARNKGIEVALGKYVAFLDPDDRYDNEIALSKLYDACEENNVKMAGGNHKEFLDGMEHTIRSVYPLFSKSIKEKIEESGMVSLTYREYLDSWYWNFIYNKEFLIQENITFPDYRRHQDPPFFYKALWRAGTIVCLDTFVIDYRRGVGNKSAVLSRNTYQILMGIRDVIQIAKDSNNEALYYQQMDMLNGGNRYAVLSDISWEEISVLNEIYNINRDCPFKAKMTIIEDICNAVQTSVKVRNRGQYYVGEILKSDIEYVHRNKKSIRDYFKDRNTEEIVLYGIGNRGLFLLDVLEEEGVNVRNCIDQNAGTVGNIKVKNIGDPIDNEDHAAILISLKESNKIEEQLKEYYQKAIIIGIEEVLSNIKNNIS